jgi:hypothetical protein
MVPVASAHKARVFGALVGTDDRLPDELLGVIDAEQIARVNFLSRGRRRRDEGRAEEDRDRNQPAL